MEVTLSTIIKYYCKVLRMTKKKLQKVSGLDKKEVRALLKDKIIITQEIAEKLEKAFDMPPKYWFSIQKDLAKEYGVEVEECGAEEKE